jgi:hypothetical protein
MLLNKNVNKNCLPTNFVEGIKNFLLTLILCVTTCILADFDADYFKRNYEVVKKYFYLAQQPPVNQGLLIYEVAKSRTSTYNSR